MSTSVPGIVDRAVSVLSYLSAGIFGVVWLIICSFRKNMPNKFVMFNIMQSIFLSLCYIALNFIYSISVNILSWIPFINRLVRQIVYWFNMPMVCGYSIIQCFIYGVVIYLVVTTLLGKYSYIPLVSDIVRANSRE